MTGSPYPPEMGPTPPPSHSPVDEAKARRERTIRRIAIFLSVVLTICLMVGTAVGVVVIIRTQSSRGETLAIIKDCTQPSGKCNKRNQAQLAGAIASVQRIVVLSAACAAAVAADQTVDQRIAQITACVTKRLAEPPAKKP